MPTLEFKTRILPGGIVQIPDTGLPEGREVTVQIVVDEEPKLIQKSFLDNLGDYKGRQLFRSVEEVDRYIREERDSWGD